MRPSGQSRVLEPDVKADDSGKKKPVTSTMRHDKLRADLGPCDSEEPLITKLDAVTGASRARLPSRGFC